ncbi:MAG: helix-turn-helix domain-containing protein, partial [Oceanococcus sp.]
LPRATLLEQMSSLDNAHQHVLQVDAAMPRILVAHMHSLYRDAAHLSDVEATVVGDMTVALVVAALQSAMGDLPDDNTALRSSMRMRANDAIESLLRCPDLSPAMIAAKVPCSRTRLFALFSDDGGVAQYILRRRLHRVLRDLIVFNLRHYSISSIAYDWGFSNIPSFNRAFRAEFDMTPGAARQDAISLRARHDRAGDAQQREQNSHTFESWVMNLLTS